jgi:hypothetical protein
MTNAQPAPVTISHYTDEQPKVAMARSYMCWSVFNLLCCSILCGIVPLLYSFEVREKRARGEYETAYRMSRRALITNIIVTVLCLIINCCLIVILIVFSQDRSGSSSSHH